LDSVALFALFFLFVWLVFVVAVVLPPPSPLLPCLLYFAASNRMSWSKARHVINEIEKQYFLCTSILWQISLQAGYMWAGSTCTHTCAHTYTNWEPLVCVAEGQNLPEANVKPGKEDIHKYPTSLWFLSQCWHQNSQFSSRGRKCHCHQRPLSNYSAFQEVCVRTMFNVLRANISRCACDCGG
jgi:hypothetical protein